MENPEIITSSRYPGLTLREASLRDGIEVWSMLREIGPGENGFGNEGHRVPFSGFVSYLHGRLDMKNGIDLPDGRVRMTTYWLFAGERPVAMCKLRHVLTESLRRVGGHIGYCVRPSERGRGYGTAVLHLVLRAAAALGIDEVLVTCQEDNLPSRRAAERNDAEIEQVESGIVYYWIRTPPPASEER